MVQLVNVEKEVEIPESVTVKMENKIVTVKGPKGELKKNFQRFADVEMKLENDKVTFKAYFITKRKKAKTNNAIGYFENMINGVTKGYRYKSKIVFSHFPITVEPDVKKGKVTIKNLYGGRKPLIVPIVGKETTVKVDGDDVITEGIDKEAVGQTVANMQEICRLRGSRKKDPEVFMDGIWRYEAEVME